jgi:predicted RNase H-like HicB family nuclease
MTFLERREIFYAEKAKDKIAEQSKQEEERVREKLLFREWLEKDLPKQYLEKTSILNRIGLLQILSTDEIGILSFDGQEEYPLPMFETIKDAISRNPEFFETKFKQGFSELEIVPFALPLSRFIETLEIQLIKHHQENKLFRPRENETDPLLPFNLNKQNPFQYWHYGGTELENNLVYFPKTLNIYHQGKTKKEILEFLKESETPGYLVILREKNLKIPVSRKEYNPLSLKDLDDQVKTSYRKQLITQIMPLFYFKILKTYPNYQGESGQIPEEWLTIFLINRYYAL